LLDIDFPFRRLVFVYEKSVRTSGMLVCALEKFLVAVEKLVAAFPNWVAAFCNLLFVLFNSVAGLSHLPVALPQLLFAVSKLVAALPKLVAAIPDLLFALADFVAACRKVRSPDLDWGSEVSRKMGCAEPHRVWFRLEPLRNMRQIQFALKYIF